MIEVLAPFSGQVQPLEEVPDPVFAQGLVGPGAALDPGTVETLEVLAPVAGNLVKVLPHAFVVQPQNGPAVMVHIGIDTVGLKGQGFTVVGAEGQGVRAGELVVRVDARAVREAGLSLCSPVVVLDLPPGAEVRSAQEGTVAAGSPLCTVHAS